MADPLFDLDSLASPLSAESPSGDDLVYDAQFIELETVAAGKPERQYGDNLYPAEPPEWPTVQELALALAGRTRDLRLAVLLARSGARLRGLGGFVLGLSLVHALLERQWDTVHPQLDASDNNDPTMRMNALAPLVAHAAGLADLRAATLAPVRGSLTVRELELGLGGAEPEGGETVPTEGGVLQALQGLMAQHAEVAPAIAQLKQTSADIAALCDAKVGSAAPEFGPLLAVARTVAGALARIAGEAAPEGEAGGEGAGAPAGGIAVAGGGPIRTRADAVQALERVCEWIERNEPSNPAPLLIRRAQRLMAMNFIEIIRDLAPDGLTQVGTIAGVDPSA
jgi:type VI secretion system protein ImpA